MMEESSGAQYALQIALQTLRERCQQFQQRIATLEEENVNLRSQIDCCTDGNEGSLSEINILKQQLVQLTEQKVQLANNIQMMSAENRHLWARLSKLVRVNENLGSKLNKINDTLSQCNTGTPQNPHAALIRSKTFTQDEPHIKFLQRNVIDENDKISMELEDISLKLISTIAKEKSELEMETSQMQEIQNNDTFFINSYAYAYPISEVDDAVFSEFDEQLNKLKKIKLSLRRENELLQKNINTLKVMQIKKSNARKEAEKQNVSVEVQTEKTIEEKTCSKEDEFAAFSMKSTNSSTKSVPPTDDKICPICSRMFHSTCKFVDFQSHVESHFIADNDSIDNFEVLP